MLQELDTRLQYGSGMRAQRIVEGAFLIAAFFSADVRFAAVTLVLTALQTVSPRLAPVALVVAALRAAPQERRLGDFYFDLGGTRGACAVSTCVLATGIWLVGAGHGGSGWLLLAVPTASLLLAPTVGFCGGCAVYVAMNEMLAKLGLTRRYANGACDIDIDIDRTEAPGHQ